MGRAGSGPEFRVNSGSGWVGSLHLWVGLSQVKKIGPTSNSALLPICCRFRQQLTFNKVDRVEFNFVASVYRALVQQQHNSGNVVLTLTIAQSVRCRQLYGLVACTGTTCEK